MLCSAFKLLKRLTDFHKIFVLIVLWLVMGAQTCKVKATFVPLYNVKHLSCFRFFSHIYAVLFWFQLVDDKNNIS
jgi:hypothetical protein